MPYKNRMVKISLILIIGLFGCKGQLLERHNSPSGQYLLDVELGNRDNNEKDKYGLMFKLIDKDQKELDYISSGSSNVMKWAVAWYNDSTIILDSHDVGTYGWTIGKNKKLIPLDNVTQAMEDKAVEAFIKKYGKHTLKH
jgi:hypothetical protein